MNLSKKNIVLYGAVAVLCMLAGFYFVKSQRLSTALDASLAGATIAARQMQDELEIRSIDSLLSQGKYKTALDEYAKVLAKDSGLNKGEIEMRINLTRQLISLESKVGTSTSGPRDSVQIDTIMVTITPAEIRAYDSLRFELEKSEVEISHLKRKLQNQAIGTYITFDSRKGNHIHYVGEVQDGKANGRGIAILNTGSRYEGQWKNNMRHGDGTFYWPDGEYYVGNYQNDIRNGRGTYYWPSGEKYIGEWHNDKRNGEGVFYGEDGEVIARGIWKNDELVNVDKDERNPRN